VASLCPRDSRARVPDASQPVSGRPGRLRSRPPSSPRRIGARRWSRPGRRRRGASRLTVAARAARSWAVTVPLDGRRRRPRPGRRL